MAIKTKLLAILEKRMQDYISSRTGGVVRPVAMSMQTSLQEDVKRILMQRLAMIEISLPEHQSDAHKMESCSVCKEFFHYLRYKHESSALEFISMNRDLFAEIELSH